MNNEIKFIKPFKRLCVTVGNLPTSYIESMSYYECLTYFMKFLENQVIPAINVNAEVVKELQDFVANYFDNLDVQEEINNKLDDMAESGQLAEIIGEYINSSAVLGFNTITDMKNAENLIDGSFVKTFGLNSLNDGKGEFYKIRTLTVDDTVDEVNIVSLNTSETLIAEKINNYYLDEIYKNCFYEEITYSSNRVDGTDYYLTTIPKYDNDGNIINLYVDKYTGAIDNSPNKYAQKNLTSFTSNAALAIKDSDDQYHQTLIISDGQVINPVYNFVTPLPNFYQYICFDDERNITSYQANATTPEYILSQGVKQAFLVWWKLINEGQVEIYDDPAYNLTDDVRQILGVKNNGDIVLLTNDGRSSVSKGFTSTQAANILLANGVVNAWELDGGGSTSTNVKTIKINRNVDEGMTFDRSIKYTLNAKKQTSYKNVGKAYAEISKQKQELNKQIMDYVNAINNIKMFSITSKTLVADGLTNIDETRTNYHGNSNVEIIDNALTVLKSGNFEFNGYLEITGTGGTKYIEIHVNDEQRYVERFTGASSNDVVIPFTCCLSLSAGDIIQLKYDGTTGDLVRRGQFSIKYYGN